MEIIIFSPLITLRPRAEWRKRFFYFHSGGGGGDGVVLALGRFFRQGANLSLSRPLSPSSSSSFLRRVEILTLKCRGCGNREQTRLYFPIPRPHPLLTPSPDCKSSKSSSLQIPRGRRRRSNLQLSKR